MCSRAYREACHTPTHYPPKRIGSKAITWSNGGKTGVVAFWVKAQASGMGSGKYRAAWMHPEGTSHINMLSIEID